MAGFSGDELKDFEIRATYFTFIGDAFRLGTTIGGKSAELYTFRYSFYLSLSYRNQVPYYYRNIYPDDKLPRYVGGEAGFAVKLLGIESWGGRDSLFLKIAFFKNYSEYYNTFPYQESGFKLAVEF